MSPLPSEPVLGSLLDRWRLLERVGSGGNGIVYRVCLAERPGDGSYALKLACGTEDPRFEREAELLSRLQHPHVPGLRATGTWRDAWGREYPYLVMQWFEGMPLYDWARLHRPGQTQLCRLLAQVTRALEATHRHGMHRDVKGDNILVTSEGNAVLVDYGCCWYPGARPLTDTAVPPGTPPYRSPACLRFRYHHRRDLESRYSYPPEDDLYALGVTAYRLVTGTYPPPGTDPECADNPLRLRPPKRLAPSALAPVHPELEALIERMLDEKPEARGTASELAEAFEKAAKSAAQEEDAPVRPSRSTPPLEKAHGAGLAPEWWPRTRAPWLASGAVMGLVLFVVQLSDRRVEPLAWEEDQESQDAEVAQEEAVGLADAGVQEAVASAVTTSRAGVDLSGIRRDIPPEPRKGQRRPPCTLRKERAINGACWIFLDVVAPCDKGDFEWDGRCYMPSLTSQSQPTSDSEP